MLFQLYATDVVVGSLSQLAVSVGTFVVFMRLNMPLKAKKEFEPPTQLIKILYQQVFVWFMIPHFPFGVLVALFLWLVQFKLDAFVLKTFNAKPVRPFDAKDSGVYFAIFYLITFFIFLAWLYYIFFLQALPETDAACCNLPKLIAIGNSTSQICLSEKTVRALPLLTSPPCSRQRSAPSLEREAEVSVSAFSCAASFLPPEPNTHRHKLVETGGGEHDVMHMRVWREQVKVTNGTSAVSLDNSPGECIRQGLAANGLAHSADLAANLASLPQRMFPSTTPMVHLQEAVRQASSAGSFLVSIMNTPLVGWFVSSLILVSYVSKPYASRT